MLRGDPSTELSCNRTAIAFERTSMAASRTLMSVIRTSLSLITFGFAIYQFFESVAVELRPGLDPGHAPRNFGVTLILLGIGILLLGILNHRKIRSDLWVRRDHLVQLGLLHPGARASLSRRVRGCLALVPARRCRHRQRDLSCRTVRLMSQGNAEARSFGGIRHSWPTRAKAGSSPVDNRVRWFGSRSPEYT
jgi:putative membrane protein